MEAKTIPSPDNKKILGNVYVQPVKLFDAKGIKWTKELVFKLKKAVVIHDGKPFICRYWADPEIVISNCGNTGSWALDGSGWKDCNCEECVSGRKEVKEGWMPK